MIFLSTHSDFSANRILIGGALAARNRRGASCTFVLASLFYVVPEGGVRALTALARRSRAVEGPPLNALADFVSGDMACAVDRSRAPHDESHGGSNLIRRLSIGSGCRWPSDFNGDAISTRVLVLGRSAVAIVVSMYGRGGAKWTTLREPSNPDGACGVLTTSAQVVLASWLTVPRAKHAAPL